MKWCVLLFALILTTACGVVTVPDNTAQAQKPAVTPAVTFDAVLAKELGADDYGMRSYVVVILRTGPNDGTLTDEARRAEIFSGHLSNMRSLADNNQLVLAGPFGDPSDIRRGLYILNVKTVEEAQRLVMTDPAVKAGIFTPEYTPYYGSAALMQINSIHKRIAKNNPG